MSHEQKRDEDKVRPAQHAVRPTCTRDEEVQQSREPNGEGERVEQQDLLEEEGDRAQGDVTLIPPDVGELLEMREAVLDLPE